jgi:anti-sigma regulatory factor (Ser/Thr protein kinase)
MTDRLHVAVDADPHLVGVVRRTVTAWLAAMRWPEPHTAGPVFALSEAVSNSVEHAYRNLRAGRIVVDLAVEGTEDARTLRVMVTDFGSWRGGRPGADRGNGLALIHSLVDSLDVDSDDTGTRVAMCIAVAR